MRCVLFSEECPWAEERAGCHPEGFKCFITPYTKDPASCSLVINQWAVVKAKPEWGPSTVLPPHLLPASLSHAGLVRRMTVCALNSRERGPVLLSCQVDNSAVRWSTSDNILCFSIRRRGGGGLMIELLLNGSSHVCWLELYLSLKYDFVPQDKLFFVLIIRYFIQYFQKQK